RSGSSGRSSRTAPTERASAWGSPSAGAGSRRTAASCTCAVSPGRAVCSPSIFRERPPSRRDRLPSGPSLDEGPIGRPPAVLVGWAMTMSRLDGVHVLLVDDYAVVREAIASQIEHWGANVTVVRG